jgi:anti-sigma-K factor RskA
LNVKEYIVSGIVESYVLGLATKEEMAEFERMCVSHPEVRAAREAFEKQLEHHAMQNSIAPPAQLQNKIFTAIEGEGDKLKTNGTITNDAQEVEATPVVRMRGWKIAAAAAIILLVGSVALNFYFHNLFKNYETLYLTSQQEFADKEKTLQAQMTAYQNSIGIVRDTNMAVVRMKGVAQSPQSMATVYWDKRSKDVYLMVNNLPQPPSGKQYQLWALVNGQPVDAGMLNWEQANNVATMKNIPVAQGFAITLENAGGSPTPTMAAMYVLGTI